MKLRNLLNPAPKNWILMHKIPYPAVLPLPFLNLYPFIVYYFL